MNVSDEYTSGMPPRIAYLLVGFIHKTLTDKEHDELDAWVEESDDNMLLFEELTDENNIEANLAFMKQVRTEDNLKQVKEQIKFTRGKTVQRSQKWLYAVAASIVLLVCSIVVYRLIFKNEKNLPNNTTLIADAPPGGNKATLTLSDGSVIQLTDSKSGLIKKDKGADISLVSGGQISYKQGENSLRNQVGYNTLSVPRGGQFKVRLPDGSMVWLNAASTLKYPTFFNSAERHVELTGEGYFEIAKNAQQPFKILLPGRSEVKVVGTHFNIKAYQDEPIKKVTLVEGAVEVKNDNSLKRLVPGQQAQIQSKQIQLADNIDSSEVLGWKNGTFVFRDADIESIMTQVERWYDIEVKYNAKPTDHFNATITRDEPVSRLLKLLENTGHLHFKIENKIIYVLP